MMYKMCVKVSTCLRIKTLALILILYLCGLIIFQLCQHFFLRRIFAHPRYVNVIQDDKFAVSLVQNQNKLAHGTMSKGDTISTFLCVDANLQLSGASLNFPICIHEPEDDIYISKDLYNGVLYEYDHVHVLMTYLNQDPELGFLDIGANLGVFALSAAHLGHNVVAVEALPDNIARLQTSILLGNVQERLTVIQAAVSNTRDEMYARRGENNVGGTSMVTRLGCLAYKSRCNINQVIQAIYMDDLLDHIPFKKAILKIDIEGYEQKAFEKGTKLLDQIDIPLILMEWRFFKRFITSRVRNFISVFTMREYIPCDVVSGRILHLDEWEKWPFEILWKKTSIS